MKVFQYLQFVLNEDPFKVCDRFAEKWELTTDYVYSEFADPNREPPWQVINTLIVMDSFMEEQIEKQRSHPAN